MKFDMVGFMKEAIEAFYKGVHALQDKLMHSEENDALASVLMRYRKAHANIAWAFTSVVYNDLLREGLRTSMGNLIYDKKDGMVGMAQVLYELIDELEFDIQNNRLRFVRVKVYDKVMLGTIDKEDLIRTEYYLSNVIPSCERIDRMYKQQGTALLDPEVVQIDVVDVKSKTMLTNILNCISDTIESANAQDFEEELDSKLDELVFDNPNVAVACTYKEVEE